MWSLNVLEGLHQGAEYPLSGPGVCIGSDEAADIILLDEELPSQLLALSLDEAGHLFCTSAEPGLEFSYDALTWSPARAESLFSVDLHYRFGAVRFVIVRQAMPAAQAIEEADNTPPDTETHTPAPAWRSRVVAGCQRYKTALLAGGGVLAVLLSVALWFVMSVAGQSGLSGTGVASGLVGLRPSGNADEMESSKFTLKLSDTLSLGHVPPPVQATSLFAPVNRSTEDPSGALTAAGQDVPDALSALRLSHALSDSSKPVRAADKVAEPALFALLERLDATAWGKRVVVNAVGNSIVLRATLTELERRDFERLIQPVIREYGSDVTLRALIDPVEPPITLQVKHVHGGTNPVAVLEDGSRLMPGSLYEGKVVESISTSRIVLRGKDRIEIPI